MIYDYKTFENNLKIKEFTRINQRDYSLVLESPAGMKSKIATLSDRNISLYYHMKDLYIDFIVGLRDEYDKYIFQIICYNDKTGSQRIYTKEFNFEEGKEYIAAAKAEELFESALNKFKKMLDREDGGYILDRVDKLGEDLSLYVTVY